MALPFSKTGDVAGAGYIVDVSLRDSGSLKAQPLQGLYPLVVQLEMLTDQGLSEGHTLQVNACSIACCPE